MAACLSLIRKCALFSAEFIHLCGKFFPVLGTGALLKPMFDAAAMSFSSVSVALNSLRLRRIRLDKGHFLTTSRPNNAILFFTLIMIRGDLTMRRLALAMMAFCIAAFSSCGKEPPKTQQSSGSKPNADSETASDGTALAVFKKRILPIFNAKRPSSCTECHLAGVDLKDYIHQDQARTFASLVRSGLINVDRPAESKILEFIRREPDEPSLISAKIREDEYAAFSAWIHAAVADPKLLAAKVGPDLGPSIPVELVRYAREDRVLDSFVENIWSEVARCSGCHSSDQNQKQVKEHGDRVSWIKAGDPQATLQHMLESDLFDLSSPEDSLLLQKPTLQVEHGGGQKMLPGDRSYRQFRRFIDDYAAVVAGQYKVVSDLPPTTDEVSVATSMTNGIWFKLTNVPEEFDGMLLQVDLFGRDGAKWSTKRWATADRAVAGKAKLWQQTLSLTAPRESNRSKIIRREPRLPAGKYLVKVYVDHARRLNKDATTGLTADEYVGEIVVESKWPTGYGRMTVAEFPKTVAQVPNRDGTEAQAKHRHGAKSRHKPADKPAKGKIPPIKIGEKVPDFEVTIGETKWKLSELQKSKEITEDGSLVLTFWCSFCHSCRHVEHQLDELAEHYHGKVGVIALDASAGETTEDVTAFANKEKLSLPIAIDAAGKSADIFGVDATTTAVVIDKDGILRYRGQFVAGKKQLAHEALKSVLAGKDVAIAETRQKG